MATIRVGGCDPALKNVGMVKGDLDLETGEFTLLDLCLVTTAPTTVKSTRVNSDDLSRARVLYKGMTSFLADVDLLCVEIPVGSQTSRAQTSYGVCIGLLASLDMPFIECTAKAVKVAATGNGNASKQDMIDAMVAAYPDAPWLTRKLKGETLITGANEHLADAVASIHAGVASPQFKELRLIFDRAARS